MLRTALALLLALALAPAAFAQGDFKPPPGQKPPPPESDRPVPPPTSGGVSRGRVTAVVAIGEPAPDFALEAPQGRTIRLSTLHGGWVALFFTTHRDSLPLLEAVAHQLEPSGVRVLAVCADKPQTLARLTQLHRLSFTALSDPTGDVAALYGLYDSEHDAMRPGFVLVDPSGNVRMALLGQAVPSDDASRLVEYAVSGP